MVDGVSIQVQEGVVFEIAGFDFEGVESSLSFRYTFMGWLSFIWKLCQVMVGRNLWRSCT